MKNTVTPIRRALISVSDKTGIVSFSQALAAHGVDILSTGGTAKLLTEAGIAVTEVSDYTGFPEMMAGRVKTLNPKVHGGILGRRGTDEAVMNEHGIQAIDLVVVNLYPFAQATADSNCSYDDAVENIDIGGPAMVRAAAKNHADVGVVTNPTDYERVLASLDTNQGLSADIRYDMAIKAFEHTAAYDSMIANYFGARNPLDNEVRAFPRTINLNFKQVQTMRYGENPHQKAAFYIEKDAPSGTISAAKQIQGKALSFNNINDTDAALECVKQFGTDTPACVIVKHANPCGIALSDSQIAAYERAFSTDPESAFGGIIAFNQTLEVDTAKRIIENQFVEVIIAPSVKKDVLPIVGQKPNVRLLVCGDSTTTTASFDYKRVSGGLLVQDADTDSINEAALKIVTQRAPSEREMRDLLFAWKAAMFVKSNAIVYAQDERTIGIGAGQMSRVNSARIAAIKAEHAGLPVESSVMASDAFFPFRDGIENAAEVGITAVIQPGGSMRDDEVITAANEHNIAMVFTGVRHFRH